TARSSWPPRTHTLSACGSRCWSCSRGQTLLPTRDRSRPGSGPASGTPTCSATTCTCPTAPVTPCATSPISPAQNSSPTCTKGTNVSEPSSAWLTPGLYWHQTTAALTSANADGAAHEERVALGADFAWQATPPRRCVGLWQPDTRRQLR